MLARAGAESRRGEKPTVQAVVAASGLDVVEIIEPGILDGGDVLKVGRTVYVGASLRTNPEGIRQLRAMIEPRGWTVVVVAVSRS